MPLISEDGFEGIPDRISPEVRLLKKQLDHDIAERMQALTPRDSVYMDSSEGLGLEYTFSAAVKYPSPNSPGVVMNAFLSRSIDESVTLHITSSIAYEGTVDFDPDMFAPQTVMMISTEEIADSGDMHLVRVDSEGRQMSLPHATQQECLSVHRDISDVLHKIAYANQKTYGFRAPGRTPYDLMAAAAGKVLVPIGQVVDGKYEDGRYISRSELSEDLLAALDERKNPASLEV